MWLRVAYSYLLKIIILSHFLDFLLLLDNFGRRQMVLLNNGKPFPIVHSFLAQDLDNNQERVDITLTASRKLCQFVHATLL